MNPLQKNPKHACTKTPPCTGFSGPDIPVVSLKPLCTGCKMPRQGFVCNFSDGTCLKSRMSRAAQKENE